MKKRGKEIKHTATTGRYFCFLQLCVHWSQFCWKLMVYLILSVQQSFFMDYIGSKTDTGLHNLVLDLIVILFCQQVP